MTEDQQDNVVAQTEMNNEQLEQLRDAFHQGRFVGLKTEHEGMSRTLLFEVPHGHLGLTIGAMPGDGDIHLSVSEWGKEQHHAVDDKWVWVRVRDRERGRDD